MSDTFDHELDAYEQAEAMGLGWFDEQHDAGNSVKTKRTSIKSSDIKTKITDCWEYFYVDYFPDSNITGKYLFFCENREWLEILAREEITNYGFREAKISTASQRSDYCLCLYWKDDSRKFELALRYKNSESNPMKYRFWKPDSWTRAGIYSQQFLKGK